MPPSTTARKSRRKPASSRQLAEEIERIRALLHRLDAILAEKQDISLKDLTQAIAIASIGGKSIAWLHKYEQGLGEASQEGDYQQLRFQLFDMLETMVKNYEAEAGEPPA
jgi:hypothetical protein